MFCKKLPRLLFPIILTLAATALAVTILSKVASGATYEQGSSNSPLATPSSSFNSPLPTPVQPEPAFSEAAQRALLHVAKQESIPIQTLIIVADHATEYPALGRDFQAVILLDTRPEGQIYKLLVDLKTNQIEEDVPALMAAEAQAYQARYGKLKPVLYDRLQALESNDTIPVAVWVASLPGQTLTKQQETAFAILALRYPEAKAALERSGKPMDVDDPDLAERIETEYVALLTMGIEARIQPLVAEVERRGFAVTTYGGIPSFTAILPKWMIVDLSKRDDVSVIYLIEAEEKPALDTAVPTSLAPAVWGRGYSGFGVTIAILEHGNVDPNNSFLNLSPNSRAADNGVQDHTTRVASSAASFHGSYTGMAPDATILSAGENGQQDDVVTALQWSLDQGAKVVNFSGVFEEDNNVNWTDRAFDYWARQRFKTIVAAAGNSGGSIGSPGKAWNVITVGGTHDASTPSWSDDQMWQFSAFVNPLSTHGDREKPEIVAVGASVRAVGVGNVARTRPGTSFAAPQVAGLTALLIDRNQSLAIWPEATKAIIMASATHNIEGPSIIVYDQGDLRDGAGAINASLADTIAQSRGSDTSTCYDSCWWGDEITNSSFPVGTDLERTFYADRGNLIRIAITWWANADTPGHDYSFDRLDTDLDLRIRAPNGQYVAWSLSNDNNYEMVEFLASQTGQYTVVVRKYRVDEDSNYLGIALARIYRVHLPIVMKNYP
jgi:hypothetical protein